MLEEYHFKRGVIQWRSAEWSRRMSQLQTHRVCARTSGTIVFTTKLLLHRSIDISRSVIATMSWSSSSSEEEWSVASHALQVITSEPQQAIHGGSSIGRAQNLERNGHQHGEQLYNNYFAPQPCYNAEQFRRRWRMSREVFGRIAQAVAAHDSYFIQKRDAAGRLGLTTEQKLAAAIRALAYDVATDTFDEALGVSESTAHQCVERFCQAMVSVFQADWLRAPTAAEQQALMSFNAARGFPGMLGSLDCTHWRWKQCPVAWAGQYTGKEKVPTVVLEAVADQSMYFWHAFFGVAGSNNDLTVLHHSPLLQLGYKVDVPFYVLGERFPRGYYLVDGIYPAWPTLISAPSPAHCVDERQSHFAARQEACRKDIERAFGRLKATWHILAGRTEIWSLEKMRSIVITCMIIHNMTIRDQEHAEGGMMAQVERNNQQQLSINANQAQGYTIDQLAYHTQSVQDESTHDRLKAALVQNLWEMRALQMH